MTDPLAIHCDGCGCAIERAADALTLIVRLGNGYQEHRGTYCGKTCADAAEADGSVLKHPRMPSTAEVVRALKGYSR